MSDKYISRDNLELAIDGLKVGMTPDWNENDKNEPGYIRNKPFYTDGDIVHQLDEKYIPDSIVRAEDIEEAISEIDFKMDKNDPVGNGSFSMNRKGDTTIGKKSIAIGYNTTASGSYSYAEGINTQATSSLEAETSVTTSNSYGYATHAEGYGTVAIGTVSHAEGNGTKAKGVGSHAEGYNTIAAGNYTHAEGYDTIASGICSHAEGASTQTDAYYAHAEGYNSSAGGICSHAEGNGTKANGASSHAEGNYTTAQRRSQHTQGEYNILDTEGTESKRGKYAHIVGNGTSDTARSNAHTIDWNGVGWFQGGLQVGGNAQDGEGVGYVPAVSAGAQAGQILAVKAVDENGKPTEWEAVDVSNIEGSNGIGIKSIRIEEVM